MLRRVRQALVLLALVALSACQMNPVSGKSEFLIWSPEEEKSLGLSADQEIVQGHGLVADPELNNYVSSIGQRLVSVSHIPDQSFAFRVLDDPVVNAFALPGGYVYVTRGILAYLQDEGALAGVLGHEIGHVAGRHSNQRATRQALWNVGLQAASVMSEDFYGFGGVVSQAAGLFLLSYDRDQERESDKLGVAYASSVHWDTSSMGDFFGTLAKLSGGANRLPSWTSTHPDPGERDEKVHEMTRSAQKGASQSFKAHRERYLTAIDGLPFGPNPRHGFVDQGWFRHPDLAIEFNVPAEWKHQNGAAEFRMAPPEGGAVVSFALGKQNSPNACADEVLKSEGITARGRRSRSIGGFPAVELVAELKTGDGVLDLHSTFIQIPGKVVVFHSMTQGGSLSGQQQVFEAIAGSLRRIQDPGILNIQPVRLRIIHTTRAGTFGEQMRSWPVPVLSGIDLEGLALLNGLKVSDQVPAGAQLKVLVQG